MAPRGRDEWQTLWGPERNLSSRQCKVCVNPWRQWIPPGSQVEAWATVCTFKSRSKEVRVFSLSAPESFSIISFVSCFLAHLIIRHFTLSKQNHFVIMSSQQIKQPLKHLPGRSLCISAAFSTVSMEFWSLRPTYRGFLLLGLGTSLLYFPTSFSYKFHDFSLQLGNISFCIFCACSLSIYPSTDSLGFFAIINKAPMIMGTPISLW